MPSVATRPQESSHHPTVGRQRILVVDDNQASAMTLAWAMEDYGYEAIACFNGAEAVALARTFRPDIVLLDLNMPVMGGLAACRQMRADPHTAQALIIAQTAWGDADTRRETHEAGFDHHLVKPLNLDEVEHLVRTRPPEARQA